jgi:hypothetical protein
MIDEGLEIIKRLMDSIEAQKKCLQFGALSVVTSGLKAHSNNYEIQLKGMTVVRKYVTRDKAMVSMDVTNLAVSRLKMHRDSEEMVKEVLETLRVTAMLRVNRNRIYELGAITHIVCAIVTYRRNEIILSNGFVLLEIIGSMNRGKEEILDRGLVKIALSMMKEYSENEVVLASSLGLMLLACEDERGMDEVISSNGVKVTLSAMKNLMNKAELQQRGLSFMQKLGATERGYAILDSLKGSWQWLAQGTVEGNSLVHLHKGTLESKGWAMGDINSEDDLHKGKLFLETRKGGGDSTGSMKIWSNSTLKQYMGLNTDEHKLSSNKVDSEFYFETIRNLGLLPRKGEMREDWYRRVREFEEHNGIDVRDLVKRNHIRMFGGVLEEDEIHGENGEGHSNKKSSKSSNRKKSVVSGSSHLRSKSITAASVTFFKQQEQQRSHRAKRKGSVATVGSGKKDRSRKSSVKGSAVAGAGPEKVHEQRAAFLLDGQDTHWVNSKGKKVINSYSFAADDDNGSDFDSEDEEKLEEERKKLHDILKAQEDAKPPEKRRDVFVTKEREQLYIPGPLEELYPELIGTSMETETWKSKHKQIPFYEDPLRFGRTKEEIAAMEVLMMSD